MNVNKEKHYKAINDNRVTELTERLDQATKDAIAIAAEREDTKQWWRRFCMIAFLSLVGMSIYWISLTNERWQESNEVSKLEAELNLVHEKTISRKDERVDELVEEIEHLQKALTNANAYRYTLLHGDERLLAKAHDRSAKILSSFLQTWHSPDAMEWESKELGKWWTWENLSDILAEDQFLLGRQLVNAHYEIHRIKRGLRQEEDGSADVD